MTTAPGGDCIDMLLVCNNQKNILWLWPAALPGSENVSR